MSALESVKVALRTTTTDDNLVSQMNNLIDACIADLQSANIKVEKDENGNYQPLILNAICQYVKAYFLNGNITEMYLRSYESMKTHLSLLEEYKNE